MGEPGGGKWKFRPPPLSITPDNIKMCKVVSCRLGNHCPEAHGEEEMAEWLERCETRSRELEEADQSYSEKILDEVLHDDRSTSMSEHLPGVIVSCDQDATIKFSCRTSSTVWNFHILSGRLLKGATLLGIENLQHFSISDVSVVRFGTKQSFLSNKRECIIEENGDKQPEVPQQQHYEYTLKLKFHTKIYGIFKQTVVFDFGTRPLLSKTVTADVVPVSTDSEIDSVKESILSISDAWDSDSPDVIRFMPALPAAHVNDKDLLSKYPAPQPSKFVMSDVLSDPALSLLNYRERMHQLLYIEEMSQFSALEGFNALIKLQLTTRYLMSATPSNATTAKYARPGELFGRIELHSELSEDSEAGRLILTKCNSILLKFGKSKDKKKINKRPIWECVIEDTAKSVVYVRLSAAMVSQNKLRADLNRFAEVQFKLSRISMVEMHHAVDKIKDLSIVYPDISLVPQIPWNPKTHWVNLDSKLNLKQKEAIMAITTPININLPPILIIGPYGTGKTFTLGKAVEYLVKQEGNKILICTHSNSAADLYIREYLNPTLLEGKLKKKLLRVYYHNRWVQSVHPAVQKYCLIDTDPVTSTRSFKSPKVEDLADKDVVVATLSTSRSITELLPAGYFTHILLDEAAQAMETEAIIPLILATKDTRVVLAGDHMQIEPRVTSEFALEKNFNISLLERIYDSFPTDFPCKILLCENYRSHDAIVSYTSDMFYEQKLVASGKQPAHPTFYPLTFFTARGEDVQDPSSTSFYNNSEVYEIVDRIAELRRNWPMAWGERDKTEIGVLSPYHDQVTRIRTELRKKKLHNISVERVLNVQGKQYRAIFISTVRTRKTCLKSDDNDMKLFDYGFLSSVKLLNTAVTRSQSLIAVVGDPVALVSVGKCRKLWENFLKICLSKKSLYGFTWDEVKSHLQAIELKRIYGLNPLAPAFVPRPNIVEKKETIKETNIPPIPMGGVPPSFLPFLGMVPNRFFNPPPQFIAPPSSVAFAGPRGIPLMQHFPPLPPQWARPQVSPRLSSPILTNTVLGPTLQSFPAPAVSRMNMNMLPFMALSPQVSQHVPSLTPTVSSVETIRMMQPSLAGFHHQENSFQPTLQEMVVESIEKQTLQKILPTGVDMQTMLSSPELQQAWHSHLISTNQLQEAEAFIHLVRHPGTSHKTPLTSSTHDNSNIPTIEEAAPETPIPPRVGRVQSPDSGCYSSPPVQEPTRIQSEQTDLVDVFETLMADFDSEWASSNPLTCSESVPLYMRRGHTLCPEESGERHDLLDIYQPLESVTQDKEEIEIPFHEDLPSFFNLTESSPIPFSVPKKTDEVNTEPLVQTYAGVLRSPPKRSDTDPLIKIRNLGTMGSSPKFFQ